MKKALLVIDYINDICHPEGKLSQKGYADFIEKNKTIKEVNSQIQNFREKGDEIIFVKIAFQKGYIDQPKNSPLFGKAHDFGVLQIDTWGTDFLEQLEVTELDTIFVKNRVSAFSSNLHIYLQERNIAELYLAGCATDLATESTAREAHDKDYNVFIISHACAAASEDDHQRALVSLHKISSII